MEPAWLRETAKMEPGAVREMGSARFSGFVSQKNTGYSWLPAAFLRPPAVAELPWLPPQQPVRN